MSDIIIASFGASRETTTRKLWKIDRGIRLQLKGLDLPTAYQVHFSNEPESGTAYPVVATSDTVEIPAALLQTGQPVYAWVYLTPADGVGYTRYMVTIPVTPRPGVTDEEPAPVQQSAIDQAIAALNVAVDRTETAAAEAEDQAKNAGDNADAARAAAETATNAATAAQTARQGAEDARDAAQDARDAAKGYAEDAEDSAQSAARIAADIARDIDTAAQKAGEAAESAQAARESADNAAQSEEAADISANAAERYAGEASTSAANAAQSATAAATSAQGAETAKGQAEAARDAAQSAATQAGEKADAASTSATAAADSAKDAADSAEEAKQSAEELSGAVDDVAALKQYVRELSPLSTVGPAPVVTVQGAAPLDAEDLVISIEPVQEGEGDPSPENVRPITGWTGAKVQRTRKNLWNDELYQLANWTKIEDEGSAAYGYYNGNAQNFFNNVFGFEGSYGYGLLGTKKDWGQLTISFDKYSVSGAIQITFNYSDGTRYISSNLTGSGHYSYNSDKNKICIGVSITTNVGPNAHSQYLKNLQIEIGGVETDYEPYQGDVQEITWESEAGTVYGGTLDVTTGTLTVDRGSLIVDGYTYKATNLINIEENSPYKNIIGKTVVILADLLNSIPYNDARSFSSHFIWYTYSSRYNMIPDSIAYYTSKREVLWASNSFTTLDEYNNYLQQQYDAGTPVTLVFPYATPITYQLTPRQVALLRGLNNVWADTGDTTLSYRRDVATILANLTSPEENDMTADTNYAVNSFFTIGGTLYKATAAIATGETIIPGTNCEATTVAEQLTALNNQN